MFARNLIWLSVLMMIPVYAGSFNDNSKKPVEKPQSIDQYRGYIIRDIQVSGNTRTKSKMILIILKMRAGDVFNPDIFRSGMQRIRNTSAFYDINYKIRKIDGHFILIHIQLKDMWSLLPSFDFTSGGGIYEFVIGLYEGNLFGELKELGGEYKNLNGEHFFRLWYIDRYLFGSHIRFRLNIFRDGFISTFYNSDRDILIRFLRKTSGGSIDFLFPIYKDVIKFYIESHFIYEEYERLQLYYNTSVISSDYVNFTGLQQFLLPIKISLRFGKVDIIDNYYHNGQLLSVQFNFTDKYLGSGDTFYSLKLDGRIFYQLYKDITIGHHWIFGKLIKGEFYRQFYLGGLNNLRGFLGTRFHGENIYLYNMEVRIPFYKDDLWFIKDFVASVVLFSDVGYAWDGGYFSKGMFKDYAIDAGIGFRFLIRQIRNAQARIDFGFSLHPFELDTFISMGINHFF